MKFSTWILGACLAAGYVVPALANLEIYGQWTGKCVRPGHPDEAVDLEISKEGIITFFNKPVDQPSLNFPHIEFTTTAGHSSTPRKFVGDADAAGKNITAAITDPNGISISCQLLSS